MAQARSPAGQEVPPHFAEELCRMRDARDPKLNAVLAAARGLGWRTATLASVLGIKPPACSKRIERAVGHADIDIPEPQHIQTMLNGRRLSAQAQKVLREQQQIASRVNGAMGADHPDRIVSLQFTEALARLINEEGFTPYYLGKVLGVTHRAITSRLERHGYRKPCPSVAGTPSGVYRNRKIGDPVDQPD